MADSLPRKKFGHASWDNPIVTGKMNIDILVQQINLFLVLNINQH